MTTTEKGMQVTLRTINESPIKKAPVNDVLKGAFSYCLLTDGCKALLLTGGGVMLPATLLMGAAYAGGYTTFTSNSLPRNLNV